MSQVALNTRRRFLKGSALAATGLALANSRLLASAATSVDAHIEILPGEPIATIAPELYSHFIEHLGGVIYDGVWVGEGSKIPNQNGIRKAFIDTMREVQAPVLRWPGGCFADSYDWRDGIGPRSKTPQARRLLVPAGHQRLRHPRVHGDLLRHRLQALPRRRRPQPPARDFYQWVEYCNAPPEKATPSPTNAQPTATKIHFNVQYWGVGNESWGCGGEQTPEEYAGEFRRYSDLDPQIRRHPAGTKRRAPPRRLRPQRRRHCLDPRPHEVPERPASLRPLHPLLHLRRREKVCLRRRPRLHPSDEHYDLLTRGSFMENVITDHWSVLSETDPNHRTRLILDEWGAWYGKGTELSPHYNLSQQSTMRDALLSGITLDIFHRHAEKVAMANVAQSINCIHSLMLAQEDKFCVTPTFHVFKMYMPHRGAQPSAPIFSAASIKNPLAIDSSPVGGNSTIGSIKVSPTLAGLSGSASISTESNGQTPHPERCKPAP